MPSKGLRSLPLAALVLVLASCQCPEFPADELRYLPGFDLSTPTAAVEYFQEALLSERPYHEHLVFSEALKAEVLQETGNRLSLANYQLARDQVIEALRDKVGSIDDVEVDSVQRLSPDEALVTVSDGRTEAVIRMVLERAYLVRLEGGRVLSGPLPAGFDPDPSGGRLRLDLPVEIPEGVGASRIFYESVWKFRGIESSRLARELGEVLKSAPPPPTRPDGTPPPRP